ncbi:hypothetical protein, partial [Thiolapillus sp.]|uniref:hypothetical protein n=1 Tax=Thiolapillus sp. TaxID=2017437 RepID=UPI003AF795A3
MLLRTWLPYDWTPRSEAYFVFPLAQGTPGKQCGLAATGVYQPSLRSPWLAAVEQQILDVLSDIKSTSDEDTTLDHLHEWVSYGYDQNTGHEREPDAPFPPGAPFVAMRVGNNEGLRIDVLTEETLDSGTA